VTANREVEGDTETELVKHCATCICGRRAPVQGTYQGALKKVPGTIAWNEYLLAYADYNRRYPGQSAERLVERGGFDYWELTEHLGHEPKTWEPR
jgi:hypothetical protein